jgi:hypothetical protein
MDLDIDFNLSRKKSSVVPITEFRRDKGELVFAQTTHARPPLLQDEEHGMPVLAVYQI